MHTCEQYESKKKELLKQIQLYTEQDVVIAFSGGVDSSLLLKLACDSAKKKQNKVYAVTINSEMHPHGEVEIAKKVAEESGALHQVFYAHELDEAGIESNPIDRCYRCKKYLFGKLLEFADSLSNREQRRTDVIIIDGTNKDDLQVYRPGIRAVRELGILSPLADAGFTKEEVRKMATEWGVSVAKRPSAPCLATRFPYGTKLDFTKFDTVEKGEVFLRGIGFHNIRLRVYDNLVRIEVDEEEISKLLLHKNEIITYLKSLGYDYITVDLEGFRSGSMDIF